jgi:hypothetical protein
VTDGSPRYVTFDRWDEAHRAMLQRVGVIEETIKRYTGAEQIHEALAARISTLEQAGKAGEASEQGRRDRLWIIVIGMMTGIVCPLIVTTIITWLHLKTLH